MMRKIAFIPGLAMTGAEYQPFASLVAEKGYETLHFDNPCVGDGPRIDGDLSIKVQAEEQWRKLDPLLVGGERLVLFGLSMGGMIASQMAKLRPDRVSHLIVAASSPNALPFAEAIPEVLAQAWLNARTKEDLIAAVDIAFGRHTRANRPDIVSRYFKYRATGENKQNREDFKKQLSAIRSFEGSVVQKSCKDLGVRSLVIAGEEDELFPKPHSVLIAELLGAHLVEIKNVGHMLHLEAPEEMASIINNFVLDN
jgi:pimeloyl-ACP methyl ester carboxylesterase